MLIDVCSACSRKKLICIDDQVLQNNVIYQTYNELCAKSFSSVRIDTYFEGVGEFG